MATTYKVLGQVVTTAPVTAAVTANLIANSTFAANTAPTTTLTTAAATNFATFPGAPSNEVKPWRAQQTSASNGTTSAWFGTLETSTDSTSANGSVDKKSLVYRVPGGTAQGEIQIFSGTAAGTSDTTASAAYTLTPGATYYVGANVQPISNSCSFQIRIGYYNSAGVLQTYDTLTGQSYSPGSWSRYSSSFTVSTNTAYAYHSIVLRGYSPASTNDWGMYVDNITLSLGSPYGATYPDIASSTWPGTTAGTVSPFNIKLKGLENGAQSNTVLSYYGDLIDLYTVPSATQAVASTLTITNMNSSAGTYRVAVVPSGQTMSKKHFVFYNISIDANSTQTVTIGQTLAAGDKIKVSAETDFVSFSLFGSEIA